MATLSIETRQRILNSYDNGEGTREKIAARYKVSVGMVKKLLQQRRDTGDIAARHHLAGRKPVILPKHREIMSRKLQQKPVMTLAELRDAAKVDCTLPAIHRVLTDMGFSYEAGRWTMSGKAGKNSKAKAKTKAKPAPKTPKKAAAPKKQGKVKAKKKAR